MPSAGSRSQAGEIDDPRGRRDRELQDRGGYRQQEREQWWYMAPPPAPVQELAEQELPEKATANDNDNNNSNNSNNDKLLKWYDLLQGHWLVGEDDSPHRVTVRLHRTSGPLGEKPILRASFYRADRMGIRNENFRLRFAGSGSQLSVGGMDLEERVSSRLWVLWRAPTINNNNNDNNTTNNTNNNNNTNNANNTNNKPRAEQHWFRGEEPQMLTMFFMSRVQLHRLWLHVDVGNSLQARYDAERQLGLLEACIRWRLLQAPAAASDGFGSQVWVRLDLSNTLLGDDAVQRLLQVFIAAGAQCRALRLQSSGLTPAGLCSLAASLRSSSSGEQLPLAELDLRTCRTQLQESSSEAWLQAVSSLVAVAAPVAGDPSCPPLWLALGNDQEAADTELLHETLAARLKGCAE
ncbi:unnamed protein product, partial [Polarella glacialis]